MFDHEQDAPDPGTGVPAGGASAPGDAARRATTAVEALGTLVVSDLAGDDQLDLLETLGTLRERVEATLSTTLATVHVLGVTETTDALPAKAWLAHRSGCARSTAARSLALGRTLQRFPVFAAAVAEGRLSVDHAHGLASACNPRVTDKLVAIDTELRDLAVGCTVEAWRRHLRTLVELVDADGAPPPDPRDVDTLTLTTTSDGRVMLGGEFSGDHAVVIRHLLDAEVDRQRRAALADAENAGIPVPSAGVLRARAVMELFRRAAAHGPGTGSKPEVEAVVVIDTTRTLVPVPDELLGWDPVLGRLAGLPRITAPDGEPVPPHAAALLGCDALFAALAVDDRDRPLRYGRDLRRPTREQRLVLANRDGGCVFPGCDAPPRWCDAHHVRFWSTGGGTDIEVLALLCRRHHGTAHSKDWSLTADPCEHAHTPPGGRAEEPAGRPPDRPAAPGPTGPGATGTPAGERFRTDIPNQGGGSPYAHRDEDPARAAEVEPGTNREPLAKQVPGTSPVTATTPPACPHDPNCPGSHTFTWTHHPTGRRIPAQNATTRHRRAAA